MDDALVRSAELGRRSTSSTESRGSSPRVDADQRQTEQSFAYKWGRRSSYESDGMRAVARRWLLQRYGFDSPEAMRAFFAERETVLDAGCGSGFSVGALVGVRMVHRAARRGSAPTSRMLSTSPVSDWPTSNASTSLQADVLDLPLRHEMFGAISLRRRHAPHAVDGSAFHSLVPLLRRGGEFLFYVYRRKAPVREFTTITCGRSSPSSPRKRRGRRFGR